MYNKIKLKKLVDIRVGYTFRGRHDNGEKIKILMAKNIVKDSLFVDINSLDNESFSGRTEFLENNDVILANRGTFKAGIIKDVKEKIIAQSSVYILRVFEKDKILPEFLAIWLNSKKGQNEIFKHVKGATIQSITRIDLEDIKINIPKIEKQKDIIELYLAQETFKEKVEKKIEIYNNLLNEIIK